MEPVVEAADDQSEVGSSTRSVLSSEIHLTKRQADQAAERLQLASKEDKAVHWLRIAVIVLLATAAILLSVGCGIFMGRSEHEKFQENVEANASKMLSAVLETIQRKMESLDTLSASLTTYAMDTGAAWPNVTLPEFSVRAAGIRALADTPLITVCHFVTDYNRMGWEAYTQETQFEHYNKLKESDLYQRRHQDEFFSQPATVFPAEPYTTFPGGIVGLNLADGTYAIAPDKSGPYFPVWHISPVTPFQDAFNFNLMTYPGAEQSLLSVVSNQQARLDRTENTASENLGQTGAYFRSVLAMGQYRHDVDDVVADPTASLFYPVFSSFLKENRTVVAVIAISVLWKHYFSDVLPSTAQGMICVMSNSAGQKFSYRIDGEKAVYIGDGDHHDPSYDYLRKAGYLSEYNQRTRLAESLSYTSVPINFDQFDYQVEIYPSADTERSFLSGEPWAAAILVALIFVFTGAVFVAYSFFVDRRQGILMQRAIASGSIVSSLFPSQVRDQLYKETQLLPDKNGLAGHPRELGEAANDGVPIAQKFESTSIIFADIRGFTHWSSQRCPEDVFVLLEALYGAFDKISFRRKVFKVETVGDCYVAVTGLPDPQKDHAVILCRFAEECMTKMSDLVHGELSDKLGADTQQLCLRIGINSGSVIAGVLRGDKGRFQLFGDVMNVASRMESTGQGGRIQISESTKNELVAHGKAAWVAPRDDVVEVKGKGKTRTYWLLPSLATLSLTSQQTLPLQPRVEPNMHDSSCSL